MIMVSKVLAPLVVLALIASVATAARYPSNPEIFDELPQSVVEFQAPSAGVQDNEAAPEENMLASSMFSDLEGLLASDELNKREKWPIHIVTKYLVKPDRHINFVHRWWRYYEDSSEHKGIVRLSLNKVAGDNIVWSGYTVYEDVRAVFGHLRSEALRDFGAFLMDSNIAVEYELYFKIGGCRHKNGGCLEPQEPPTADAAEDNKRGGKKREWPVRLVTKYIVEPSELREFVEEWERLEKDLAGRDGNLALALFKPAADNTVFVSYSAWESHRDFFEAARRKSTEEFLRFLADRNIVAITRKLWQVPSHHP